MDGHGKVSICPVPTPAEPWPPPNTRDKQVREAGLASLEAEKGKYFFCLEVVNGLLFLHMFPYHLSLFNLHAKGQETLLPTLTSPLIGQQLVAFLAAALKAAHCVSTHVVTSAVVETTLINICKDSH